MLSQGRPAQAVPVAYTPHPANAPIGTAKGLMPGRVAWVHDPQVTDWDGASTAAGQRWYDKINQTEATNMMQWALTGYADTTTTAAAWDAIFRHFNGGAAYQPGEKVFIKINLTTSNSPNCASTPATTGTRARAALPGPRSGNRRSSWSRCSINW